MGSRSASSLSWLGRRAAQRLIVAALVVAVAAGWHTWQRADARGGMSVTEVLAEGKVPVNRVTLGDPNAPVMIAEYVDLRCPGAARFYREELPGIVEAVVRPGKAKFAMFAIAQHGKRSAIARDLYVRLANTDHAWAFADVVLRTEEGPTNNRLMNRPYLRQTLAQIPQVTAEEVEGFKTDPQVQEDGAYDQRLADHLGLTSTPAVLVGLSSRPPTTYRQVVGDCGRIPTAADVIEAVEDTLDQQT
jgi:protein-disulfide isomerase